MSSWSNTLITILQDTKQPISSILSKARTDVFALHPFESRLMLSCLLRDNVLPLSMRLQALLLLSDPVGSDSDTLSRFLYIVFDILDSSNEIERWLCYNIVTKNAYTPSVLAYSADDLVNSLSTLFEQFPLSNAVMEKVESCKNEYYRSQLSSPDMLPFMSFDSNCFLASTYPTTATRLSEYASLFPSRGDVFLYSSPSFDRPSLSFSPSRDDFTFLPTTSPSDSFLYFPIIQEEIQQPAPIVDECRKFWSSSLNKQVTSNILADSTQMESLVTFLHLPASPLKSRLLASMFALNPEVMIGLTEYLKHTKREQFIRVLCLEPWWEQKSLDQFLSGITDKTIVMKKDLAMKFVKLNLKRLCNDLSQEKWVSTFCQIIRKLHLAKVIDESMIHDDLIDLRKAFSDNDIVRSTLTDLYGKDPGRDS